MKEILLIYTGGTIGMVKDYDTKSLRPLNFDNIFAQIPELSLLDVSLSYKSLTNPIDSSDMNIKVWEEIGTLLRKSYDNYDGFVILHGTDTMAYTASALSFMINGLDKPIIFTGSQLPIGDLRTDAKENLLTSIHYAALHNDSIKEVCIYFEYKLYRANRTTKISAEQFEAFTSPNYPFIGISGVHLNLNTSMLWVDRADFNIDTTFCTKVLLIKLFPGLDIDLYRPIIKKKDIRVIILEAYGSGNMFSGKKMVDFFNLTKKEDIAIIVITQCSSGSVSFGKYSSSNMFIDNGAISGNDLTTEAAITKAMHLLPKCKNIEDFQKYYIVNLKGEMSSTII